MTVPGMAVVGMTVLGMTVLAGTLKTKPEKAFRAGLMKSIADMWQKGCGTLRRRQTRACYG